jgi:hypothetical protein
MEAFLPLIAIAVMAARSVYLRWKAALDCIAGSVMAGLGVRLASGPLVH